MAGFKEINDKIGLADQMQSNEDGSIVFINVFTIDPADESPLLAAWSYDADFIKAQPGYISTQLHEAIGSSSTYVNYAVWESVESFRAAFTNLEFQKRIGDYPESAVTSPYLFKKLAVPGHCVG